jgi:hypothetical protein
VSLRVELAHVWGTMAISPSLFYTKYEEQVAYLIVPVKKNQAGGDT